MSSFAEAWRKAGDTADDYDPPNGTMPIVIIEAGAFAGRDGREWAKCVLEVTDGVDKGRQFDHFMNLNNEVGFRIARESLVMYGLDTSDLDDPDADLGTLGLAMGELVGTAATVTVTHKDGFRNVRVDGATTTRPGAGIGPNPDRSKSPDRLEDGKPQLTGQQSFDAAAATPPPPAAADDDGDEPLPF